MTFTNTAGINLIMAGYLADDQYDYRPNTVSATTLMKPVKQYLLSKQVPAEDKVKDITNFVKSRIGTSVHDSVERVWTSGRYKSAMRLLGYNDATIDKIRINPGYALVDGDWEKDPAYVSEPGIIPVYVEIRSSKVIEGVTVTGKFDSVAEGTVGDIKTTSVYTWMNQTKAEDYKVQGSIYKWLNQDIITGDTVNIHYVFTDFSDMKSKIDSNYPPTQVLTQSYPLMSLEETERWIVGRLRDIEKHQDKPQSDMPVCTDRDLWRKAPVYKYYKNPNKLTRSTKNHDTLGAANLHLAKDGNVGTVISVPGQVIACRYCDAFPVCRQKDVYLQEGTLKLN